MSHTCVVSHPCHDLEIGPQAPKVFSCTALQTWSNLPRFMLC
nr:soluble inorganic pyrophosphatase-like [Ipomoea batatas]